MTDAEKWNGKPWFVWIEGLKGPTPQVWMQGQITRDQKPVKYLQRRLLTDADIQLVENGFNWSLNQLTEKYPYDPTYREPPPVITAPVMPKPPGMDAAS